MSDTTVLELVRAGCAESGQITEGELRYQLGRRNHPLAETTELLAELLRMEKAGLLSCELQIKVAP